jgi:hypothetical protein
VYVCVCVCVYIYIYIYNIQHIDNGTMYIYIQYMHNATCREEEPFKKNKKNKKIKKSIMLPVEMRNPCRKTSTYMYRMCMCGGGGRSKYVYALLYECMYVCIHTHT